MKRVYITWSNENTRSKYISHYFKLEEVYFGYFRSHKRSLALAAIRYPVLCLHTFFYLLIKMPDVVFSVNLPVFEPFIVWIWATIFRKKFVIDNHSALFERKVNSRFLWLIKPAFKRAALATVTNRKYKEIIESWGGKAEILPPLVIPNTDNFIKKHNLKKQITVISSFDIDEPIKEIISAAEKIKDVDFYFTGSLKNLEKKIITNKPDNVHFTDFIKREEFLSLVNQSICAIVLTKEDNTLLRGAYEAMSLETPLIISDFAILKEAFNKGVIHVDNSVNAIVKAVNKIISEYDTYKIEITKLKSATLVTLEKKVEYIHDEYKI